MITQKTAPEVCLSRPNEATYTTNPHKIAAINEVILGIHNNTHRGPVKLFEICGESDFREIQKVSNETPGIDVVGIWDENNMQGSTNQPTNQLPQSTGQPYATSKLISQEVTGDEYYTESDFILVNLGKRGLENYSTDTNPSKFHSLKNPYAIRLGRPATNEAIGDHLSQIHDIHQQTRAGMVIVPYAATQSVGETEEILETVKDSKLPLLVMAEVSYPGLAKFSEFLNGAAEITPATITKYLSSYAKIVGQTGLKLSGIRLTGVCGFSASDKRRTRPQDMANGTLHDVLINFNHLYNHQ